MAKRKSPEQKADAARRYALADAARSDDEFEKFLADPNQAIRNAAVANPAASARVLAWFADDPFWSVRVTVAQHPNTSRETLLRIIALAGSGRGAAWTEAVKRLKAEGVPFDEDGNPVVD